MLRLRQPSAEAACERLCPSDATACSPRVLATKIATRLFTNGFGDEGTRLDIRKSVEMVEHSLGGWCYQAAVDQIEKAILEENDQEHLHRP